MKRGVFSNEAGLGSAPLAAASAKTNSPVEQGLINMTGTFLDTMIICMLTGIALIVTGAWSSSETGVAMTSLAFSSSMGSPLGSYAARSRYRCHGQKTGGISLRCIQL